MRRSRSMRPWAALLVAAAALVFAIGSRDRLGAWFLGRAERAHPAAGAGGEVAFYTCSMDPSVEAHEPGKCPICGMDLTPVSAAQRRSDVLHLDKQTIQRIAIRTGVTEKRTLQRRVSAFGPVVAPDKAAPAAPPAAWVEAVLHGDEAALVAQGTAVGAVFPAVPLVHFDGTIAEVRSEAEPAGTRLRVALADPSELLSVGMAAEVQIDVEMADRLVIPAPAVLYAGQRRIVFVAKERGAFEPRQVTIGVQAGDLVEVVKGLSVGERVAVSGTFLLAAESRIRSSSKLWEDEPVAAAPAAKPAEARKGGTP